MSKFTKTLTYWTELSNRRIQEILLPLLSNQDDEPKAFNQAILYVIQNGGKRIRPTLVYLTAHVMGGALEECDPPAFAVELIHTYSLVHDDLPAMDDDNLRRGKAACHKAFDEATAILVGDALQTLAFEILASHPAPLNDNQRLKMIQVLANASGIKGMCKGQALDMQSEGKTLSLEALKRLHACKTGALIKASILLGALSQNELAQEDYQILEQFADMIGLAFQVQDDILDIEGTTESLGKPQGSDARHGKVTFPLLMGLDEAKNFAYELCETSKASLQRLKFNSQPLCNLAEYIIHRVV